MAASSERLRDRALLWGILLVFTSLSGEKLLVGDGSPPPNPLYTPPENRITSRIN
jgi:hypothetical protein